MPRTKIRRDSLKDFFFFNQLALTNRNLSVVSLCDPMSPPEQNQCNVFVLVVLVFLCVCDSRIICLHCLQLTLQWGISLTLVKYVNFEGKSKKNFKSVVSL